jgi:AMP deaminase
MSIKTKLDKISDIRKKNIKILHGNTKINFNKKKLKDEYNKFSDLLDKMWSKCQNNNIKRHCYTKLIHNYNEFNKYNQDDDLLTRNKYDFYDVYKMDNHIHLSAIMTTKELKDYMTKEQISGPNINIYKMNTLIDSKNIKGINKCDDKYSFNDFNNKYYIGSKGKQNSKNLRSCFLKLNTQKNKLKSINTSKKNLNIYNLGKFNCEKPHYANLGKLIANKRSNTIMDLRISIYGTSRDELKILSKWFFKNNLHKNKNINLYIQVPRIPHIITKHFTLENTNYFDKLIEWFDNVFEPFFNAVNDPKLKIFLKYICGFDSVDNEDEPNNNYYNIDTKIDENKIRQQIKTKQNPFTYSMYIFLMWKYISKLNSISKKTFKFKPHAGELGNTHHLLTAYLLSDSICHGINLIDNNAAKYDNDNIVLKNNNNIVMLYLYIKDQIGCALAPISNNYLCRKYSCLHLDLLFKLGLRMSLCTDDPLMFHLSDDPVLEEFSMAKNYYNFTNGDLLELVNNSYLIGDSKLRINLKNRINLRNKLLQNL